MSRVRQPPVRGRMGNNIELLLRVLGKDECKSRTSIEPLTNTITDKGSRKLLEIKVYLSKMKNESGNVYQEITGHPGYNH